MIISESVEDIRKTCPVKVSPAENNAIVCDIKKAEGQKCERCWNYSTKVGQFQHRPELCERCVQVIDDGIHAGLIAIDAEGYFWTDLRPFNDEAHLPMSDHIEYWAERFGETYRRELEQTATCCCSEPT
jgi:hypothetical protein